MQTFDFSQSVFAPKVTLPKAAQVIFVSDMFVEDYVGGAELTSEALISTCPWELFKLHSRDVTPDLIKEGSDRFWIFGNFTQLDPNLIQLVANTLRYSVLEYDYKFCRARSPEKHFDATGMPCDCAGQPSGRMISAFFYGSMGMWWMSEAQRDRYLTAFPYLSEKDNVVLSSVFDKATLERMADLHAAAPIDRKGWIVLGSDSWVKGARDAEDWCKETGKQYKVVWNVPYQQLLERMSRAEGFVYLPKGGDTCPRMVIEAKLLGCKLHLNDNVQHRREAWFDTDELQDIQDYLLAAPARFWDGIKKMKEYRPTISGYTTTYNCAKQAYPFEQCIASMLQFCDEVCVVDGGSTDSTWERLVRLAHPDAFEPGSPLSGIEQVQLIEDIRAIGGSPHQSVLRPSKLKLREVRRDWSAKHHPVFDGMQKAEARSMCTQEFCWQMDCDEVVHEDDGRKVRDLCRILPKGADIMALPVIEYWGGPDKVRMDIQPWKWRLSRNLPHITHGIPRELRRTAPDGRPYAAPGTDGCDMVDRETGDVLPHVSFYPPEVEQVRRTAMMGVEQARQQYEQWFNQVVSGLPCVFHYSWYDLERKVRLYRDYWQNHWNALWDRDTSDTAENNLMFGVPWKDVTDEMIAQRADLMRRKLGGWVWHRPWDGKATTPHVKCSRSQPAVMKSTHGKV